MKSIGIILGNITNPSGTERAVCNLANILVAEKMQVVIVSLFSSDGKCFYDLSGSVKIIHGNLLQNPLKKRIDSYLKYPSFINRIVSNEKLDIILATGHQSNSLLVFASKKVKRVACEHMSYSAAPFYSSFFRRMTYPFLDAVICLTNRDACHYKFIKKDRLFVIPNSLPFKCETPSRCDQKVIIAVGRLTYQKGFDLLLDSALIMKKRLPDWKLKIFGSGEEYDSLVQKIGNLNLQNFVSLCSTKQNIMDEYTSSSVMVVSSRWEGFPMVIVEAQNCGLPVVSFDCPYGPADIVKNDETGFIVPLYDTESLAQKIVELALDENKRKVFGRRAKELSQRFSTENVARMWKDVLEKICCHK